MKVIDSKKANKYRPNRCPQTGKLRYRDHKEAVRALHRAANASRVEREMYGASRRAEIRAYRCDACGGHFWHLTSQVKRDDIVDQMVA